jgi:hypothetical protein
MASKSSRGLSMGQQRRQDLGELILTDSVYEPRLRMPVVGQSNPGGRADSVPGP